MKKSYDLFKEVSAALDDVSALDHKYFRRDCGHVPSRKAVVRIVKLMQQAMFPAYFRLDGVDDASILTQLHTLLGSQISLAFCFAKSDKAVDGAEVAAQILRLLPEIKKRLYLDAIAIYEGDPAAVSPEEVILCYPGFYAISVYRIAHEFYLRHVPFIGRIMTEFAHEKTGIDIHAGATIGDYFCIDHGTGIVIGETATIGERVKIYQGVTIGAKSFEVGDDGNPIKGIKRHPDIGNNVVIYANATILGGDTHIGDRAVIGGNTWVTESVEADSLVYYGENRQLKKERKK